MKIGYFADGPWSHRALKAMVELPGIEISFITPRFDTRDSVLKDWAERLGAPYIFHENVNSERFINEIKGFDADLLVSMSFNQILKREIINLTPKGFINCHAGALPFYRGRNPLNWVLINGESQFGVTAHYVDEGIDTGDIILQEMVDIAPEDDYGSLLDKAFISCSNVLVKAVDLIKQDQVVRKKQEDIHPIGTYFGRRRVGDETLNWSWSSERIHNFIRAITRPGPCARTYCGESEIAIVKSELITKAPSYIATEGEVIGRGADGVVVKTGDRTLKILKVASIDSFGNISEEFTPDYSIGTRFSNKKVGIQ